MGDFEVARDVVMRLREWRPRWDDNAAIELAEVVSIGQAAGVLVLWAQHATDEDTKRFGLLISLHDVVQGGNVEESDAERIYSNLWLAVVEPHGSAHPGTRAMFYEPP